MVYNRQNYCVFWLCPSSGILNMYYETQRFGNLICFRPQVRGGRRLLGPLKWDKLNHWTSFPSSIWVQPATRFWWWVIWVQNIGDNDLSESEILMDHVKNITFPTRSVMCRGLWSWDFEVRTQKNNSRRFEPEWPEMLLFQNWCSASRSPVAMGLLLELRALWCPCHSLLFAEVYNQLKAIFCYIQLACRPLLLILKGLVARFRYASGVFFLLQLHFCLCARHDDQPDKYHSFECRTSQSHIFLSLFSDLVLLHPNAVSFEWYDFQRFINNCRNCFSAYRTQL
jgi:hypothetical protein